MPIARANPSPPQPAAPPSANPSATNLQAPTAEATTVPTAKPPLPETAIEGSTEQAATLRLKCLETDANGKGKAKAVVTACRPALEAAPGNAEIMVILARAEIDRGRPVEARALAKKALAADPQRLDAYVYLGTAEQAAGKPDEARAAYKKYLELAPDGPFARELRAILSNL